MMISGSNPATSIENLKTDYFYSKTFPIWGWATWKRAWECYDKEMKDWPKHKNDLIKKSYNNFFVRNYYTIAFENSYNKLIDTWDYQWVYTCLMNNGLCIIPKYNLISNIGTEGTHTSNKISAALFKKTFEFNKTYYLPPEKTKADEKIDKTILILLILIIEI
jgi:hypothetical protein